MIEKFQQLSVDHIKSSHKDFIEILEKNKQIDSKVKVFKDFLLNDALALHGLASFSSIGSIKVYVLNIENSDSSFYKNLFLSFLHYATSGEFRSIFMCHTKKLFNEMREEWIHLGFMRTLISPYGDFSDYECEATSHLIWNGICFREGALLYNLKSPEWREKNFPGWGNECAAKCQFMKNLEAMANGKHSLISTIDKVFYNSIDGISNALPLAKKDKPALFISANAHSSHVIDKFYRIGFSKESYRFVNRFLKDRTEKPIAFLKSHVAKVNTLSKDNHHVIMRNTYSYYTDLIVKHHEYSHKVASLMQELLEKFSFLKDAFTSARKEIREKLKKDYSKNLSSMEVHMMENLFHAEQYYNRLVAIAGIAKRFPELLTINVDNVSRNSSIEELAATVSASYSPELVESALSKTTNEIIII